ncbi:hypothetical protein EK21DRAFT_77115 [Setomelanomma holmii]|uniref:Rhodopsin domain-containing protein n=1 Tax=Setomelanomma holmii TaxID=210430 RepID=A0A9P4GZR8_9PLEO|nr:hypothetical protein EK21DRAFT_77115 [Setomelanomma holmii]
MTSRFPTPAEFASFPPPNYVDPFTKRPVAMGIMIPMTALVVGAISCRFYSRTVIVRTLGWDDWLMLIAAILSVASNIMILIAMGPNFQLGYHLWDLKPQIMYGKIRAAQMSMANQLLFTAIVTLMKVAILLTYLRIFPSRLNKWFCRSMIVYTIILSTMAFFFTLFQCNPVSTYWEIFKYIGTAKCLNVRAIYYYHSAQNTFSDFVIFLWPAKDLLNVKISRRQRITLTCMFSLGVIVCVAGSLRIYYTSLYLESYDVMWHGAECFIVMSVEGGVGVACGCLPGCKPLMNRLFPRFFAGTSQNSYPKPSAQDRLKQLEAGKLQGSATMGEDSYKLRSMSVDEIDLIIPPPAKSNFAMQRGW